MRQPLENGNSTLSASYTSKTIKMKKVSFWVVLLTILFVAHSCKEKEITTPEPSSYAVSSASGVLLTGDSSLIRMSHLGLENIPSRFWLNHLGFIPKSAPQSIVTLVPYANPYTLSIGMRMRIISDNSPIAHLFDDIEGGSLGYSPGGMSNTFPISTNVDIELIPRGINVPSKYTNFIVVTADSCIYIVTHYIKQN